MERLFFAPSPLDTDSALQTGESLPRSRVMALSRDALQHFKPETVRGTRGYFRVGLTEAGQWWLIGPDDLPFFARAVNGVRRATESTHDPVLRMRSWGFNALGAGSAPALVDEGLPFLATINFFTAAPLVRAKGVKLPDVFDSSWSAGTHTRAEEVCAAWTERTDLLGWLTDDGLRWGAGREEGGPSLLQICLSLEPSFAAYHAAWEFALAHHGGQLARLGKAWGCTLENKGVIRELTRSERGVTTAGYGRDDARWTREFAQRYFATTSAAIRAHDPNHLILGARYDASGRGTVGAAGWLAESVFPTVDLPWIQLRDLKTAPSGPLFVGNFSWSGEQPPGPAVRTRSRRGTSVERMLRHGRATLRSTLSHPSVVGYAWNAWCDEPEEQPPFGSGLVHVNDVEAREHTELLADVNGKMSALRPFAVSFTR